MARFLSGDPAPARSKKENQTKENLEQQTGESDTTLLFLLKYDSINKWKRDI